MAVIANQAVAFDKSMLTVCRQNRTSSSQYALVRFGRYTSSRETNRSRLPRTPFRTMNTRQAVSACVCFTRAEMAVPARLSDSQYTDQLQRFAHRILHVARAGSRQDLDTRGIASTSPVSSSIRTYRDLKKAPATLRTCVPRRLNVQPYLNHAVSEGSSNREISLPGVNARLSVKQISSSSVRPHVIC